MARAGMADLFAKRRRRVPPAFKAQPELEDKLHKTVARHLDNYGRRDWQITHFPAGEKRDKRTGAKLKLMGLKRGWPDFQLVSPQGIYHGLELKRAGEDLSKEQLDFQDWANRMGVPHAVCFDLAGVLDTLGKWGALRITITNGMVRLGGAE